MFSASQIESSLGNPNQSETFGIYVGFQAIQDCKGPTKIGRTINVKALQRGRNQGGADWWFAAFWPLEDREATYAVEKKLKQSLIKYSVKGSQGQKELYSFSVEEAIDAVTEILGPPLKIL